MTFAITGSRGRLAPIIARHLESAGHTVDLYSRAGGGAILPLSEFPGGGEPDHVIHCAWSVVPFTAEADPGKSAREDLPLLEAIVRRAPRAVIHFLSTGAVYGDTGDVPADEETPARPLGAYASGKLAAERLLAEAAPGRHVILRTTNLLGEPPNPGRPQGVLPRMIAAARGRGELEFWGDGSATKDYLFCDDFLAALDAVIRTDARGIFNAGSGVSHSLNEILAEVERLAGKSVPVKRRPHFSWDVSYSRISVARLGSLGWSPRVSLREAVERCWEASP